MFDYKIQDKLCLVKTNKYKTINLFLNFSIPIDIHKFYCLKMLDGFMGEYSHKYPTKATMSKARDSLYEASIASKTNVRNNLMIYTIRYSFINPKFLKDLSTKDYIEYFKECFNNICFSNELLNELKTNLKAKFNRLLDKPTFYAKNRLAHILALEDKRFEYLDYLSHINKIDDLTLDDVKETYDSLLKDYAIDVSIVGDYDDELLEFSKSLKNDKRYYIDNKAFDYKYYGEKIEEKDISQSVLTMLFFTPYTRKSDDFFGFVLGTDVLGGGPTSLLFEEIREKLSLCYHISAADSKNDGRIEITTLIDKKNYEKTKEEILRQIKRLINKDYDLAKLDEAKTLFIDSLRAVPDELVGFQEYLYRNELNDAHLDIEDYIEGIKKVSADDISKIFKNAKLGISYFLKGRLDE